MGHLERYLLRNFVLESLSLLVIGASIVWLTQMLRLFDVVTVKGQNMLVLVGQSFLTMSPLSIVILGVCMSIGVARTLTAMQTSRELHSIHAGRRVRAIWVALGIFVSIGTVFMVLLTGWVDPSARRAQMDWSAKIATDVLSRTLKPHTFTEVTPGFVVEIGQRLPSGEIKEFFADDSRVPTSRRTYVAERAAISSSPSGIFLDLKNGSLQIDANGRFRSIEYKSYKLGIDRILPPPSERAETVTLDAPTLFALSSGTGPQAYEARLQIFWRAAEIVRIPALCIIIAALVAFPNARRRGIRLPMEVVVLGLTLVDRILSPNLLLSLTPLLTAFGPTLMLCMGILIALTRAYLHFPARR